MTVDATNLVEKYLSAKETVIRHGFAAEIDWQDSLCFEDITESDFLRESAWVIFCSGMREATIRGIFPSISDAFLDWRSAQMIVSNRFDCRQRALSAFAHERKVEAVLCVADTVTKMGFEAFREEIRWHNVSFLQQLPYIGPATSYHLAKNLGLDVAKPDRHLVRVSRALGFDSAQKLCQVIADFTGEKVSIVDIVIWRFATLERDYVTFFQCPQASKPASSCVGSRF